MDKFAEHEIPKAVIVAGNGESLSQIDYRLLPKNYDVFRCNQFYFEERYFLGNKIKAVFFTPGSFLSNIIHFIISRETMSILLIM